MNEILTENFQLVIPGTQLASGKFKAGLGVFRERVDSNTYNYFSALIGLFKTRGNILSVIPLKGSYIPLDDDLVIGRIIVVGGRSWIVDIRGPYAGILSLNNVLDRDFKPGPNFSPDKYLSEGDLILAKVTSFDRTRDPVLTMHQRGLKKLVAGRLIEVDPVKVPRIIGKSGSMVNMIKDATHSRIIVGQNGRILVNAPNLEAENLVLECIKKIENESHVSGLTNRIKQLLNERQNKAS